MSTYANAITQYDRYNRMIKIALNIRFDNTFGAYVTDTPDMEVSDAELLRHFYHLATPKERKRLNEFAKKRGGMSINLLQALLVLDPTFKDNLVKHVSQAAMQEAREGNSYMYRNPAMRFLYNTQEAIYNNEMPGGPQVALGIPGLRNYIQSVTVPKTQKIMTEVDPTITLESIKPAWDTKGYKRDNPFHVWTTDNANETVTDQQLIHHLWSIAPPETKKRLLQIYKKDRGISLNRLQAYMALDPALDPIVDYVSKSAMQEINVPNSTYIYKNKGMRNLLATQHKIYGDKMPLGPEWHLRTMGLRGLTAPQVLKTTKNTFHNPTVSYTEMVGKPWDPGVPVEEMPEEHSGGGDLKYIVPALAVGAPFALLGGLKGGPLLGLSLLGAAGAAGYGYGYAKTRGWKGWDWVDKGADDINGFFKKKDKEEKEPTAPEAPKVPKPSAPPKPPTTSKPKK